MVQDTPRNSTPTGAESLIHSLAASGVDICFANPGTSEMHFVVALDRILSIRPILGLFEGAVTGMADGYARMTGKPAVTLLHLGSGLGNGIANLHNAKRAQSPVVNIVGEHATYHLQWDTPLVSDIESLARPVSRWVRRTQSAATVGADAAQAVAAARGAPGGVATLILPADAAWSEGGAPAPPIVPIAAAMPSDAAIDRAATLLKSGRRTVIMARGPALQRDGLHQLGRIAAATGAELMCDGQAPRVTRGSGLPAVERVPYRAETAMERFAGIANLILVGTHPPVPVFAYPNYPSWILPEGMTIHYLAQEHEDGVAALAAVAGMVDGGGQSRPVSAAELPGCPSGSLDQFAIGAILARLMPEQAIISDEAATNGLGPMMATAGAPMHDWLSNTGGAIGQGIPLATGAAVGAPGRKVINLQADGSAMYTLQALWTQARERLDVVTILFSNRSYAILTQELQRVGASDAGPRALSMFDLGNPDLDWTKLAEAMGVEASRATTPQEFEAQLAAALAKTGPHLIEAVI
ncbi:acetolactate synthase I/II/III large subunit [Sphingobium jiangsuense]|uniref:Acetolactate synthase-1/2/3 large subunit n=1 Tax=Sphingobium jiangsuense TaxID=870476 RepID=A0A7W6FRV9_9SPHN|nr:acetolactate synthase large subunit [Sphingobium jiangsuense]MBB3928408.1 acetolactate synthase-1/2/3 large subunit [Sphingobium jiangsuense]GLS99787.1 acetolactate synthase I/II/III large subunit [Sphingobium jiangsuense]